MKIGLIAHDSKKRLMQNFCIAYRGILIHHELYATESTGRLVESAANLQVHKFLSGKLGGDLQLSSFIENNEIDLVIFLRDAFHPMKTDSQSEQILRMCDFHNIPIATNLATAELLIKSLERGDLEWREMYK